MPKGKGTYGSKVGRPPKKKYQAGGEVSARQAGVAPMIKKAAISAGDNQPNFPMENPLDMAANKMGQELKDISLESIPTSDATLRSENFQLGGVVTSPTTPSLAKYKEGGKVRKSPKEGWKSAGNVTDIVKEVEGNIRTDENLAPTKPWKELKEARKKRIAKLVTESLSKNKKGKKK